MSHFLNNWAVPYLEFSLWLCRNVQLQNLKTFGYLSPTVWYPCSEKSPILSISVFPPSAISAIFSIIFLIRLLLFDLAFSTKNQCFVETRLIKVIWLGRVIWPILLLIFTFSHFFKKLIFLILFFYFFDKMIFRNWMGKGIVSRRCSVIELS